MIMFPVQKKNRPLLLNAIYNGCLFLTDFFSFRNVLQHNYFTFPPGLAHVSLLPLNISSDHKAYSDSVI